MLASHVSQFRRQSIDRDTKDRARRPIQGFISEKRPAPKQPPTVDFRMRLHNLLNLCNCVLRCLLVIIDIEDLNPRISLGCSSEPRGALLKICSIRITVDSSYDTFS